MKKTLVFLRGVMPHLIIALSVVHLSLFILDRMNRAMNFITNGITEAMTVTLCLLAICQALLLFRFSKGRIFARAVCCLCAGLAAGLLAAYFAGAFASTVVKYMLGVSCAVNIAASVVMIVRLRKIEGQTDRPASFGK